MATKLIVDLPAKYTRVSKCIWEELGLPADAKLLYAFIGSLPPTWEPKIKGFSTLLNLSEKRVRAAVVALENAGYLTRFPLVSSSSGLHDGWEWHLYAEPVSEDLRTRAGCSTMKTNRQSEPTLTMSESRLNRQSEPTLTMSESRLNRQSEPTSPIPTCRKTDKTEMGQHSTIINRKELKIIFNCCAESNKSILCIGDIYKYIGDHPSKKVRTVVANWIDNNNYGGFQLRGNSSLYLMSILLDKYGLDVCDHSPLVLSASANIVLIECRNAESKHWFRERNKEILDTFKSNVVFDNPTKGQILIK